MAEKIAIGFDEKSLEILNNTFPELRNAAVNIAVKMLAKDPMYKKYFCIDCDDTVADEEISDLESMDNSNASSNAAAHASAQSAVTSWDEF